MSDPSARMMNLTPQQRDLLMLRLGKLNKDKAAATRPQITPQSRANNQFPLSFAQEPLWFLSQLQSGVSAYNLPLAVRLEGPLDVDALRRSITEIVRRHEALRTTFTSVDGQPFQVIAPAMSVDLPIVDLQDIPEDQREAEANRRATADSMRPFDLTRSPLLRATLLRFAAQAHVLLLTTHHIASDGWSLIVLVREIGALYEACASGNPSPLPELPIQYVDYAAWQREWLQGPVLDAQLAYWKEQLGGERPVLELPLDRPRPAVQTFGGAHLFFKLTPELTEGLRALSQREGATLFMTLLAAFKALLHRHSGQEDIIVGSPIAKRSQTQVEQMVGCFSDTLALRTDLSGNPSFRELLGRVRDVIVKAYAHQDVPYTKVVEAIQPERTMQYNSLFQVMFSFADEPPNVMKLSDLTLNLMQVEMGTTDFDLFLTATLKGGEISGLLGYNTDLFDHETIERLLEQFFMLLEAMAADPDQRFSDSPHLARQTVAISATFTAEPLEEALTFWLRRLDLPSTITFAPYNQVFQQLLDPTSLLSSNRHGINVILVRFEDWLRFEDGTRAADSSGDAKIERNVQDLLAALKSAAQRSPTPYLVGICPASPAALADPARAALFARMEQIMAAEIDAMGGVYLVTMSELASTYPVPDYYDPHGDELGHIPFTPTLFTALGTMIARKTHTLKSTPHKVIVLDADQTLWRGVCGEDGPMGIDIDAPSRALQEFMVAQHDAGMLICLCSKNDEADVVEVFERRGADMPLKRDQIVAWRINWRPKSENIRSLAAELQLGLDSFIFIDDNPVECAEVQANCPEVLVLQLPQEPAGIPDFLKHIWSFDHLKLTTEDKQRTSLYQRNIQRERVRQESLTLGDFLSGLDLRTQIAEPRPEQLARVAQMTQRTNQFNTTTIRRTEGEIQALGRSGKQCLAVEVNDRFGEYGLVGAIIFEAGAAAIEVDSFLLSCRVLGRGVEHQMLARLAEIAQARGLGRVDVAFVPSKKNQPAADFLHAIGAEFRQSRGAGFVFQIPAAVAAAAPARLLAGPAGMDAASTGAESAPAGAPLAAGSRGRPARLARLSAALPDATQILKLIESFRPVRAQAGQPEALVAPRTEIEALLADVWAQALQLEKVGIHHSFFELGGHSLLATQVISKLQNMFEVRISLQHFFETPTVAGMAERIETARREARGVQAPPIVPVARDRPLPLSFSQQRLWTLSQFDPTNTTYNLADTVRLAGALDTAALEQALNEVVRRHETLRTIFTAVDGQPAQVILPALSLPLPVEDLRGLPEMERAEAARAWAAQEANRPFDLARGPLLRARLLRLGAEDHFLVLATHHIVSDGWSAGLLYRELAALYMAFAEGRPSPLPELPIQYADFATWQRQWLQGEAFDTQLAYWKQQLAGAPEVLALPTNRPRPAVQTFRGMYRTFTLAPALVTALKALGEREGCTLFMTLLAAFKTLLYRYSGQGDIVVGCPIANRDRSEIEQLIGVFADTLVIRTGLADNPPFRELLGRVRQITLEGYDHRDVPFEKLVEISGHKRNPSYNPLFQVMLSFLDIPQGPLEIPGLTLTPGYAGSALTDVDFDLFLVFVEQESGLSGWIGYNTDLFDTETILRLLKHYETLLHGIVANAETPITQLPLMTAEERERTLAMAVAKRRPVPAQVKSLLEKALRNREAV